MKMARKCFRNCYPMDELCTTQNQKSQYNGVKGTGMLDNKHTKSKIPIKKKCEALINHIDIEYCTTERGLEFQQTLVIDGRTFNI